MFGMGTVTTKLCEPNKYKTCIVWKRKEKKKKDIILVEKKMVIKIMILLKSGKTEM